MKAKQCACSILAGFLLASAGCDQQDIDRATVEEASEIVGFDFTTAEIDSMIPDLVDQLESYLEMREVTIENSVPPALRFDPDLLSTPAPGERERFMPSPPGHTDRPEDINGIAFWPVRDLAWLIQTRQITSTELTRLYLDRLKRYGDTLQCVVTLTEDLALEQAAQADAEIAAGRYRGLLHGIPYGAKDLLAVPGYPTTWGAEPYREQTIDETATVIRRLDDAGAVLVAKLTLGALAWGDVWFGGMTRNPWDPGQGSSGSSAGSASATAAGLVAFAIGTETWGSIVSPSTRCGVTGLRPTFGRVSRHGAMALSWSMDKIGPICRTVEDCAIVFDAIRGADGLDPTALDRPFSYDTGLDLRTLRIGYLETEFAGGSPFHESDSLALATLRGMGFDLLPVRLPDYPVYPLGIILGAEAAAAFDDLTRSGRDDLLVRQVRDAWPNVLRAARFIPAVEYIQANRIRTLIMREMEDIDVDLYVAPSFGENLLLTNLTGHPCVVLTSGFDEEGRPVSITFIGKLWDEGRLLAFARAYQEATGFHRRHPPLFTD
ncbi:MAG: amidase [Candidatus Krumholzibacteria bacterium]|nr:amidase [Candidatus Krumholzibacteria bacterium]